MNADGSPWPHAVAGLRGVQRDLERAAVADLSDEEQVGVFAHRALEAVGVARRVAPDLSLRDARAPRAQAELDRVGVRRDRHFVNELLAGEMRLRADGIAQVRRRWDETAGS